MDKLKRQTQRKIIELISMLLLISLRWRNPVFPLGMRLETEKGSGNSGDLLGAVNAQSAADMAAVED